MRQIKFRGHAISDSCGVSVDKIVYGDLIHEWNKLCILDEDDDGDIYEVDPESVAQFVGVDSNGNEIYEGDIVVLNSPDYHIEYTAHLSGYATGDRGIYISAGQFDRVTLKEAQS